MHDMRALTAAVSDLVTRVSMLEHTLRSHDEMKSIAIDVVKIREVVERLEEEYGGRVAAEAQELAAKFGAVTDELKQAVDSVSPQ